MQPNTQADPPSVDQQLADARTATRNAQALADEYKASADRLRGERDTLQSALDAEIQMYTAEARDFSAKWEALIAERRVLCDLLSCDGSTVAGQTLVEAVRAVLASRDATEAELKAMRRTATAIADERTHLSVELFDAQQWKAYWEPQIGQLSDLYTRQGGDLATLRQLARDLVASLHGDGNGRCWCGAKEADRLRGFLERAARAQTEATQ